MAWAPEAKATRPRAARRTSPSPLSTTDLPPTNSQARPSAETSNSYSPSRSANTTTAHSALPPVAATRGTPRMKCAISGSELDCSLIGGPDHSAFGQNVPTSPVAADVPTARAAAMLAARMTAQMVTSQRRAIEDGTLYLGWAAARQGGPQYCDALLPVIVSGHLTSLERPMLMFEFISTRFRRGASTALFAAVILLPGALSAQRGGG